MFACKLTSRPWSAGSDREAWCPGEAVLEALGWEQEV